MSARLQDLQRSFARHLRAEGCSDRTVIIYGQSVRFFSQWLEAQDRQPVLEELTRAAIREWLAQLSDVNEPSTVKTRYRGLFRFCGWLVDEEELSAHPMKGLSPPQPKAKPVPVLTVEGLDLDHGMALVRGKGSKVRPIYFGARTARAVDRYVRQRTPLELTAPRGNQPIRVSASPVE